MLTIIAIVVNALLALFSSVTYTESGIIQTDDGAISAATLTIHEDSPLWNCRTMGNGVCGFDLDWLPSID